MLADVMKDKEEFWITKVLFSHWCSICLFYLYLFIICICAIFVFSLQAEYEEKGLACLDKLGGSKE